MTRDEIVDNITQDLWFLDISALPSNIILNHLDDSLRKFTINSGKTLFIPIQTSSHSIDFKVGDVYKRIYGIVNAHPYRGSSGFASVGFDVFSKDNYLFMSMRGPFMDIQQFFLAKGYVDALRQQTGAVMDKFYDEENSVLYINANFDYESLIIEYLPRWAMPEHDSEIKDEFICDWLLDYTEIQIKQDIWTLLKSGAAFDLPDGTDGFESATEDLKNMEMDLRKKYPFLGMSRR